MDAADVDIPVLISLPFAYVNPTIRFVKGKVFAGAEDFAGRLIVLAGLFVCQYRSVVCVYICMCR